MEAEQINHFIASHPRGNIFQTSQIFDLYKSSPHHEPLLVTTGDKGEITGMLLADIQKEHSGMAGIFSSRSIIWGGPLGKNNDPMILDQILKQYIKRIKAKAIYTQFRNLWEWTKEEKEAFEKNGFHYE